MIPVLVTYTFLILGAWGLMGVIYAHIRDYWHFSKYIPVVFPIFLLITLSLTVIGYFLIFTASYSESRETNTINLTEEFRPNIEY